MLPFLDILGPIVNKVLDFIPDPQKKLEAQLNFQKELDANSQAILASLTAVDKAQAETNTEEAKSSSLFISGWRPAIGWTCGLAFAWAYVLQPAVTFFAAVVGHPIKDLPVVNLGDMMPVLLGMLGLGGMRSWEKTQGVQDKH